MYAWAAEGARDDVDASIKGAFMVRQAATACAQSAGISERHNKRARESSPRLVSWVAVAVRPCGACALRLFISAWKSATLMAQAAGLPPTSLSAISRW